VGLRLLFLGFRAKEHEESDDHEPEVIEESDDHHRDGQEPSDVCRHLGCRAAVVVTGKRSAEDPSTVHWQGRQQVEATKEDV
jgi:hypothetical protein